jgi:hypothetical protein
VFCGRAVTVKLGDLGDAFAICREDDARLDAALASVTRDVLALLAGPREVVAAGTVPMTPADHRLSASTPILRQ